MPINKPRPHPSSAPAEAGFTLVVIAALFVAFAVIAAVAVERNTTIQQVTRRDAAAEQLNRLSAAIIEFSVFNRETDGNRYPCPSPLTVAATNGAFGEQHDDCWSGLPGSGINVLTPVVPNTDIIRGMVPVQTLSQYGISINDAFDPWNSRIIYIVNRTQTVSTGLPTTPSQANNPTVSEPVTGQTLVSPDFILISYGRDTIAGTKRNATAEAINCAAASTVNRLENCDDDTTFLQSPTYTPANAAPGQYFDDILVYYRQ
jgi:hypothetical protein